MPKALMIIGGPKPPGEPEVDAEDPGAGEGDSYGQAASALYRAAKGGTEETFQAALRAAVFALYRQYEGEMAKPPGDASEDPGY